MDSTINNIRAFDKEVHGCKRHKKDIMISFQTEGSRDFHDIFLTNQQAEELIVSLQKSLKTNSEG